MHLFILVINLLLTQISWGDSSYNRLTYKEFRIDKIHNETIISIVRPEKLKEILNIDHYSFPILVISKKLFKSEIKPFLGFHFLNFYDFKTYKTNLYLHLNLYIPPPIS